MNTYPSNFLKPLLESYELTPVETILSTELTTGLATRRAVAPNAFSTARLSWRGSDDEIALVHGWLEHVGQYDWFVLDADNTVRMTSRLGSIRALGNAFEIGVDVEIQ